MKASPVVHFEMPYKDGKRVSEFYRNVFGWGMKDAGEMMGHYVLAETTPTNSKTTRPTTPGAINGGFYPLKQSPKSKEPSFVIGVDNLEESIELVKKAGGKLLGEPQNIPGIGRFVSFRDTEGNRASMLQPGR